MWALVQATSILMSKYYYNKFLLKTAALLLAMLSSFYVVQAQVTDTLKETKVKAKRDNRVSDKRVTTYSPGQSIIAIDTITLKQYQFTSLANMLSQQVPVFVKSYGLNNVATLNFRGASAAQSQVYWNGVPVQNAALGIADVSLLPVELMNKVNVVYGSSSAMWGSGNVGGALLLESSLPDFSKEPEFSARASAVVGSFGHYRVGLKSALATERLTLGINVLGRTIKNNFPYEDAKGQEQHMRNAQLSNGTGLLQAAYKLNAKNIIGFKGWYQQYEREIPPAIFESNSVKQQRDESLRLLADWKRKDNKTEYYAKASYIRDFMWYRDSAVLVNSKNITNQIYTELGLEHRINTHHQFMLFTPVQISWIDRVLLGDKKYQNKYALAGSYLFKSKNYKLHIAVNGRLEQIDDLSIFLPGINAAYRITSWLSVKANVQKTYRVPTLNELYYSPGGNINLKPEQGWNEDAGYVIKKKGKLSIEHNVSFYNRVINDWILWFGGAIWTPHNIATVHSRGVQTQNTLSYKVNNNLSFKLGINAGYTLATTQSSYIPNDGSIDKQIPYTPKYQGQLNMGVVWKGLFFNYNHTYTGIRYITTDESYYLPAYTLGNIQVLYTTTLGGRSLQLTAQANNIWGANYFVVNARPMPRFNWLLGVMFDIVQ